MKNRKETETPEPSTDRLTLESPDPGAMNPADEQTGSRMLTRSHIPLYYQLEQILRKQIASGKISSDGPLPTENDLCNQYGVSRTTVRQAIAPLMREGLINRIPGKGSYLIDGKSTATMLHYSRSIDGLVPMREALEKTRVHYKGWVAPTARIASLFGLGSDEKAFCMRGVHLKKGDLPLNYFNITIPPKYAHLFEGKHKAEKAFITILESVPGMRVHKVIQTVKATKASEKLAKFLKIPEAEPVLEFERLWYVSESEAFMAAISFYHSDTFHLVMEFEQQG